MVGVCKFFKSIKLENVLSSASFVTPEKKSNVSHIMLKWFSLKSYEKHFISSSFLVPFADPLQLHYICLMMQHYFIAWLRGLLISATTFYYI